LLSLLLCVISPLIGVGSFLLFLFIVAYVFNKNKLANGKVDFINVSTNTIYIITDGIFKLKYQEKKFEKFEKLICIADVLFLSYRFFRIKGYFDGVEYELHRSQNRKALNKIVNEFIEAYDVEVDFQVSEFEIEDYPFTDTSYSYTWNPFNGIFSMFAGAVITLLGIFLISEYVVFGGLNIAGGFTMFLYGYKYYIGSKKELSNIKNRN